MPREKNDPDVNSPNVDGDDEQDDLPGTHDDREIREPDGDEGGGDRPDVDEPYPSPEDDQPLYPVEDPPIDNV